MSRCLEGTFFEFKPRVSFAIQMPLKKLVAQPLSLKKQRQLLLSDKIWRKIVNIRFNVCQLGSNLHLPTLL